jgi:ribosome biogenesis GTPase
MVEGIVTERAGQKITVFVPEKGKYYRGIPLGKVRKKDRIYAGDRVTGRLVDNATFAIEAIKERKNLLVRPPIANVDKVVVVATIESPPFQSYLMDNLLVVYGFLGIEAVVVFNKVDILSKEGRKELEKWVKVYSDAGYTVIPVSAETGEGLDRLSCELSGATSIFAGASGVGKSSIISKLTGEHLRVGEVSEKTERGRHTTREVRLIPFKGGFIGDAPGFSRVEALNFMDKEQVRLYFPEFLNYQCRFSDCLHVNEEGCEVTEAVKRGEIACERYKNYLKMIHEYVPWLSEVEGC